jgi:hypothetical protein
VTPDHRVVLQDFTNTAPNSTAMPQPSIAVQLANGDMSIADQFNNRALIISPAKTTQFQYGMTNVAGNGPDQLNGPYAAYAIGDYTGQTPPPSSF